MDVHSGMADSDVEALDETSRSNLSVNIRRQRYIRNSSVSNCDTLSHLRRIPYTNVFHSHNDYKVHEDEDAMVRHKQIECLHNSYTSLQVCNRCK